MIKGINHVGIVVKSIDSSLSFCARLLALKRSTGWKFRR